MVPPSALPDDLPTLFDLLERLPMGVIVLDDSGKVQLYNSAEERLARRRREDVLGRVFFEEVAPCFERIGFGAAFRDGIGRDGFSLERETSFGLPFRDSPREVRAKMVSIRSGGRDFACVLLEDISVQRAMERLKDELASLLVHDMKSPLAVMLGNLSLVGLTLPGNAVERPRLDAAVAAAHRLHRMVLGLLDIARIEDGSVRLQLSRFDLCALALAAVREQEAAAWGVGVSLVWTANEVSAEIFADAELIRRALDNLLDNATRFAPAGSSVEVWVERPADRPRLALCVRDHGPGIPEERRRQVFDKFVQLEAGSRIGNHGLGLTFVRLAAEAHGGEASVTSPPGGGCLFRIELPLPSDSNEPGRRP